jgi:hypothetical protein
MKTTDPSFPHFEAMKRLLAAVKFFSDDPLDVAALCTTLACYALRYSECKKGRSLSQEDYTKWCLMAYARSDDKKATDVLTSLS